MLSQNGNRVLLYLGAVLALRLWLEKKKMVNMVYGYIIYMVIYIIYNHIQRPVVSYCSTNKCH